MRPREPGIVAQAATIPIVVLIALVVAAAFFARCVRMVARIDSVCAVPSVIAAASVVAAIAERYRRGIGAASPFIVMPAAIHEELGVAVVAPAPAIRAVIPFPAEKDGVVIVFALVRVVLGAAWRVVGAARTIRVRIENGSADTDRDIAATDADGDANLCGRHARNYHPGHCGRRKRGLESQFH